MKRQMLLPLIGALALAATSVANAGVQVSIGLNPYGYGAYAPPVVYQPNPYYGAPPVVYYGHNSWGDGRGRHPRDSGRNGHDRHDDHDGRHH